MLKKAILWEKLEGKDLHCYLCSHQCRISPDNFGICGMRKNDDGELYTYAYGKVIANHIDPIEKKPFYHFLPGTNAYSVATIGCNFKCSFCQNWTISQTSAAGGGDVEGHELTPEEVVREAERASCDNISYTYTEPTIFFEYAYDIAKLAKEKGLSNSFVTNGFMTKEAIDKIAPYLDAANVDLKFFNEASYERICKGHLNPVLGSIEYLKKIGIWVEVTTLIVPGENDSEDELRDIAHFLAGVDINIPWHISRFHPDYKYTDSFPTPVETIKKAVEIGKKEGLLYIYPGNISISSDTVCPGCGTVLIERKGFNSCLTKHFDEKGICNGCRMSISGVWKKPRKS